MSIQWFPGHMARARREVQENLLRVDVVLELLDARLPYSSRNPLIAEITTGKPRLVLLNKADLADEESLSAWVSFFQREGLPVLRVNSQNGDGLQSLVPKCQDLLREKRDAMRRRGIRPPAIRGMILGIPNVGKSTLINRLALRKAAKTGNRPGITTQQQWIKVGAELQLLDTPGILWPRFEDQRVGFCLAASGAIRDEVLPLLEVALFVIRYLASHYPQAIAARYSLHLEAAGGSSVDAAAVLEQVGRRRGCLVSGGEIDLEKAAEVLLTDLRNGKLGPLCLERPEDIGHA